jgi:hypothetical protein
VAFRHDVKQILRRREADRDGDGQYQDVLQAASVLFGEHEQNEKLGRLLGDRRQQDRCFRGAQYRISRSELEKQ